MPKKKALDTAKLIEMVKAETPSAEIMKKMGWGKLEKMDTKVYDERQTEVSRWNDSHTASTPKN